jgi:iron complex transport system permease protein
MASLTNLVVILDEGNTQGMLFWLLGGVDGKGWEGVMTLFFTFSPSVILSFLFAPAFDVMILGDEVSAGLGQNPIHLRLIGLFVAASLVAGTVTVCGPLAFIGLIVPHIAKKIMGNSLKKSMLFGLLSGGCFLLLGDMISRIIQFPYETPVGIISGMLGALYFLYFSLKQRDLSYA